MVDWIDGPGEIVGESFETAMHAFDDLSDSFRRADTAALRAANRDMCVRFIDELPAVIPTPDPELTRALQGLLDDAHEWLWTERELSDPLTPQQRETIQSRGGELLSRMQVVGAILERDYAILEASGRG